jgi:outer membrane receptor protein involved in Fe transport
MMIRSFPWLRVPVLLLLSCWIHLSFGQANSLKGTVSDTNTGETLIGATVLIKGTTIGAVTDVNGKFELKVDAPPPYALQISFIGYSTLDVEVKTVDQNLKFKLGTDQVLLKEAEVIGSRISDKQKQAPMTVETMDVIAIREAASGDFYESLGSLKGVDMTSASMGFKIINTRGFNSTSPVRSLQLIDGVDNQSPGLNFSLGNFLGASELDVMKVDLIVGAASAYYGPNAFNGAIIMTTKDPFLFPGLSVMAKVGERNMVETGVRYAEVFKNKAGKERFAFKLNFYYFTADDWVAENDDPTEGSSKGPENPGGYDAVNRYGDEQEFTGSTTSWGLGSFYRDGYWEKDLVDYDTQNLKTSVSVHYKLKDDLQLVAASNFGTGTTVYQGDNRFRLKDILFFQHRLELNAGDKGFLRAYLTTEDAGRSYDAVFTAFRLQEMAKDDNSWFRDYTNHWISQGYAGQVFNSPGFPQPVFSPGPPPTFIFDQDAIQQWYLDNNDFLVGLHDNARSFANSASTSSGTQQDFIGRLVPGTPQFDAAFNDITSRYFSEGGTRFFDRSSLVHLHGERRFSTGSYLITTGGNIRQYRPNSRGNIFSDTAGTRFTNEEFGVYGGVERRLLKDEKLKLTATMRVDKNVNFPFVFSPAGSAIYSFDPENILRVSFSSAIRNPTLQDQFLFYNVGRAILRGNLNGVNDLVTIPSLLNALESSASALEYFDIAPVVPEKVKTIEVGFRNTILKNLFVDGSYYYSFYEDFLGFQLGADVDVSQINQVIFSSIQPYRVAANASRQVTTQGFSIGLNYFFAKFYALAGNYSWNKLNTEEDDPIIPAFNTPEHKYNITFSARDINTVVAGIPIRHWGFNINYRWVESFLFEGSPQFTGTIPTYDLVDLQISRKVPKIDCIFRAGASNLLNNKVYMVYGGPLVGRLAYLSVTYEPRWGK